MRAIFKQSWLDRGYQIHLYKENNNYVYEITDPQGETIELITSPYLQDLIGERLHGDPRFYELLDKIAELHSKKNHDYADNEPLSNFKLCERAGIEAWKGVLVRMSDKLSRLFTFAKRGNYDVNNESVVDTALDLAVYSLIFVILFQEAQKQC